MLAVIRIARGSVATDAFSQRSLWILKKKRLVFSLCGQSKELNFINQTIDFVGFPFKVYRSTGGFCRSGFSTKPLAAQTLGAQTDNMRLCTTLRCKKCPSESEKVLFSLVGPVLAG